MKKIFVYIRYFPIVIFATLYNKNERLREDLPRWDKSDISFHKKIAFLLFDVREFRNLFIYRNRDHKVFYRWAKFWYRPEPTLYIECPDIGGGFYIQHGFSTYIAAQKIGKNFSINQQITIGHRGTDGCPLIGDNVMVTCGAKVLGNIEIGDNTRIGANAVVLKDYKRGHGVLVGVPAVPKKEATKELLQSLGVDFDESLF